MSQIIDFRLLEDVGAVAATSRASTETLPSQDGDLQRVLEDGPVKSATPSLGGGTKRSRDVTGDHRKDKSSKRPKTGADPSTIKVTGAPQYNHGSQEELWVVPPTPKSLFEELRNLNAAKPTVTAIASGEM